jgi:uncharacterized protein (TIGR02271 family)
MTTQTLTALYDTRAEADAAMRRLTREAGVAATDMTVVAQDASAARPATGGTTDQDTGFFASLKEMFMPDEDRHAYSEAIRRGGFLLTAKVGGDHAERAMDILEEHGAVDLDGRQESWRAEGWKADAGAQTLANGTVVTTAAAAGTAAAAPKQGSAAPAPAAAAGKDESIALVEESLRVGKRAVTGGRVRVRSYVVETPVEEQVTLREESVSVERRDVDRPIAAADEAAFRDRTIEATATSEEAVVSKTAHVTGEVVVSKGVEERVETVRDTVRRTEVEVEDDRASTRAAAGAGAAGKAPAASPGKPADPAARR